MGFLEKFGATYANNVAFFQNWGNGSTSGVSSFPFICIQKATNYIEINMINPSYMLDVSGVTSLRQGLILNNLYFYNFNKILFTYGSNI